MKRVPCFLALVSFLAALGCQATVAPSGAKTTKISTTTPTPAHRHRAPYVPTGTGSIYATEVADEVMRQRYGASEEEETADSDACIMTGEFNLAPDGQSLLMETWCGKMAPIKVEDTLLSQVPGKPFFYRVAFQDTVVSVHPQAGQLPAVRLHYREDGGTFQHLPLEPKFGGEYVYSFADLSPDTVHPMAVTHTATR